MRVLHYKQRTLNDAALAKTWANSVRRRRRHRMHSCRLDASHKAALRHALHPVPNLDDTRINAAPCPALNSRATDALLASTVSSSKRSQDCSRTYFESSSRIVCLQAGGGNGQSKERAHLVGRLHVFHSCPAMPRANTACHEYPCTTHATQPALPPILKSSSFSNGQNARCKTRNILALNRRWQKAPIFGTACDLRFNSRTQILLLTPAPPHGSTRSVEKCAGRWFGSFQPR